MATYKVLQDIEAEDKILGPLTLRQFIYGLIAALMLYLSYLVTSRGLAFMLVFFLPVALVFGFFTFPWGRDQPTEVWALAKIRFFIKPRRKIWSQSGIRELVTITAPKKELENLGPRLSQTEVKSRLHALADTIDSRGWAVKNANVNMATPALMLQQPAGSDRLVDFGALPQPTLAIDVQAADDILDEKSNPRAAQFDSLINASEKAHRQKIEQELSQVDQPGAAAPAANNYWFLNQTPQASAGTPSDAVTFTTQVVDPGAGPSASSTPTVDEDALARQLDEQKQKSPTANYYGHMPTILPLSQQKQATPVPVPPAANPAAPAPAQGAGAVPAVTPPQVTPAKQAAILQLANNDDLNVATLAREAKRSDEDEVVVKLR